MELQTDMTPLYSLKGMDVTMNEDHAFPLLTKELEVLLQVFCGVGGVDNVFC